MRRRWKRRHRQHDRDVDVRYDEHDRRQRGHDRGHGDTDDSAGTDDTTEDTDDPAGTDDTGSTPTSGTGDSGAPATEEDFVAAAASAIGFQDTEMSECMAQALVDGIGFARIEASGVSPEEFTSASSLVELDLGIAEEDAADVQAAITECGDIVEAYLSSLQVSPRRRTARGAC